jgi:ParB family chromosome partitioning protein
MRFELEALPQFGVQANGEGVPLLLALDSIDEDPLQPRREFDPEALQQLAASIAERGVLQAVSVRRHPEQSERWILNFGARRLRASKLAGQMQIPAFVNETANSYDQVIENEQREGLKPLELALFVQRCMAAGDSQAEIARRLGKSPPYVTYATALIDAPDWLMTLYREGRCRGLRELHELRQLQRQHPECVLELQSHSGPISRDKVASMKSRLDGPRHAPITADDDRAATSASIDPDVATPPVRRPPRPEVARAPTAADRAQEGAGQSLSLFADLHGATVEVVVDAAPSEDHKIFVRAASGADRLAVDAASLRLIRIAPR